MSRQRTPADEQPEAPVLTRYQVTGPHRVHEIPPGEDIDLDPEKPETARLLARGHIGPQTHEDPPDPDESETINK